MKQQITLLALLLMTIGGVKSQTVELFNGKDLSGWNEWVGDTNKGVFSVKEGAIHCTGNPMGFLYTKEVYTDYQLHVEWRWDGEASNSGIFIFMQPEHKHWCNAIEVQLCAGEAGDFVLLGGSDIQEFKTGEGEKRPDFPVVKGRRQNIENLVGEWNCADITVQNGSITVYINGVLQNYGSKSPKHSGHIALQSEGKAIEFRHIRLTPLD